MPGEIFSQTLVPSGRRTRSRWTIAGSLVVHVIALAAIFVVPIVTGATAPSLASRLDLFVMASVPPTPPSPPAPAPPATRTLPQDIKLDAAPTSAAEGTPPEPVNLAASGSPGVPGMIAPIGPAVPGALFDTSRTATIAPPPPQKPAGPIRIGGDVKPPRRIAYAPPVYPQIAMQARVEGTVTLEATIDQAGVVQNLRVVQSIPLLDQAAIEAVRRWRYTPTLLNGVPVPVLMSVSVTFLLR